MKERKKERGAVGEVQTENEDLNDQNNRDQKADGANDGREDRTATHRDLEYGDHTNKRRHYENKETERQRGEKETTKKVLQGSSWKPQNDTHTHNTDENETAMTLRAQEEQHTTTTKQTQNTERKEVSHSKKKKKIIEREIENSKKR